MQKKIQTEKKASVTPYMGLKGIKSNIILLKKLANLIHLTKYLMFIFTKLLKNITFIFKRQIKHYSNKPIKATTGLFFLQVKPMNAYKQL